MKKNNILLTLIIVLLISCNKNEIDDIGLKDNTKHIINNGSNSNEKNKKLYSIITDICGGGKSISSIVEVNPNNGETSEISKEDVSKSQSVTFNPNTQELYFSNFKSDLPKLLKININTGVLTYVNINHKSSYCHLDEMFYNQKNKKLYGIITDICGGKKSISNIVVINPSNGETSVVSNEDVSKSQSVTFNPNTQELYFSNFKSDLPKLLKININTGISTYITINHTASYCHLDELIII